MEEKNLITQAEIIAFAKVGVDYLKLIEQEASPNVFVTEAIKLIPALYSMINTLPDNEFFAGYDFVEEYISEENYDYVRNRIKVVLGEKDRFLTTFNQEMKYSDTPLVGHISEAMADTYQHVANLLGVLRDRNEEALPLAIGRCKLYWREYFGLQMTSALSALHQIYTAEDFAEWSEQEGEEGLDDDLLSSDEY